MPVMGMDRSVQARQGLYLWAQDRPASLISTCCCLYCPCVVLILAPEARDRREMPMEARPRLEVAAVQAACRIADGRPGPDSEEASLAAASSGSLLQRMISMNCFDGANVCGWGADGSSGREDTIVEVDSKADRMVVADRSMVGQPAANARMEYKAVVVAVVDVGAAGYDAADAAVLAAREIRGGDHKARPRFLQRSRGRVVVVVGDPLSRQGACPRTLF